MADPVTLAAAARYVYGAFSLLGGSRLSAADRAALDASGTQPFRGVFRGPNGLVLSRSEAIARGNAVLAAQAPIIPPPVIPGPTVPRPPPRPTGPPFSMPRGGTAPPYQNPVSDSAARQAAEEFRRRRQPPQPPRPPPAPRPPIIDPNLPYYRAPIGVLVRILGGLGGLIYPTPTSSTDTIPGRPPGSQRGPTRRPRIRRRPEEPPQPIPQPPAAPVPRPTPQPPRVSTPLEVPQIWQQPIPQPTAPPTSSPSSPPSSSSPTSSPTSSPFNPLWVAPLALLRPTTSLRDPLTQNPLTPGQPRPGAPPSAPPPRFPVPGLTPFQPPGLGSRPTSQSDRCKPCRCKEPRKKKRKKREPRRICYRGTFIETRSSTQKFRKEKIRCR